MYSNPWKDITSYEAADRQLFKGRDEDIERFLNILSNGTFSVIYSSSGIGKTSFLNAGIEPHMMESGFVPVHIVFHWVEEVESEIISTIDEKLGERGFEWRPTFTEWDSLKHNEEAQCRTMCENSLWWRLRTYELVRRDDAGDMRVYQPLLIFDQFEEVFRNDDALQSKQREVLFQLLQTIYSYTIPEGIQKAINIIFGQGFFLSFPQRHLFKVIFALRKEYLSDFDHWTNELHAITDLQRNRMLLKPMDRNQASEVITKQPLLDSEGNIVGGKYTETLNLVNSDILDFIDAKHKNEVEPFLLSVLCKRLYDRAVEKEKKQLSQSDLKDLNIGTVIRSFYESLIQQSLKSRTFSSEKEIVELENILVSNVDGHRERLSLEGDKTLNAFIGNRKNLLDQLEKIHLIRRTTFGDATYVELIHDRLADVIHERQKERRLLQEQKRGTRNVISLRFALILATLITIWCTIYWGVNVRKNASSANDLTRINTLELTTNDTAWIVNYGGKGCNLKDNSLVEKFIITGDSDKVFIRDCFLLNTIEVKGFGKDELTLCVEDCPQLMEIVVRDRVKKLNYRILGCPRLQIRLNHWVEDFNLDANTEKVLTFKIDENNPNYLWKNQILWDLRKENERIIYAQHGTNSHIPFPPSYEASSLSCGAKTFSNSRLTSSLGGDSVLHLDTVRVVTSSMIPNRGIREVFLGDSVDRISEGAFKGCKQLRRVHFPKRNLTIELEAFAQCASLDSVIFPCDSVYLGSMVFAGCTSMQTMVLPRLVGVGIVESTTWKTVFGKRFSEKHFLFLHYIANPFMECPSSFAPQITEGGNLVEEDGIIFLKNPRIPVFVKENAKAYNAGDFFTRDGSLFVAVKRINALCWLSHKPEERQLMKRIDATTDSEGALFLGYVVLPFPGATEITIPSRTRNKYYFPTDVSNLQAIHIPYPQPEGLHDVRGKKTPTVLDFNLPDSVKEHITLYIPAGSMKYYENSARFKAFNAIREEGAATDVYLRFARKLNDVIVHEFYYYKYLYFLYPLIALFVGGGIFLLRRRQLQKAHPTSSVKRQAVMFALKFTLVAALLYAVVVPCFMVFTSMSRVSPIYAGNFYHLPIAFLTLGVAAVFMYAPELINTAESSAALVVQWITALAAFLRQIIQKVVTYWKQICSVVLLILLALFVLSLIRRAYSPAESIRKGKYDRALKLYASPLHPFLTKQDRQQLRSLLIRPLCIPGVADSTVWEDVSGWNISYEAPYFGLTTPDGFQCYDLKNKQMRTMHGGCSGGVISPTGRYVLCRDDSTYVYGENIQWTFPPSDVANTHWLDNDRYLFLQKDSACYVYDMEDGSCLVSSDFNFRKSTKRVGYLSTAPRYSSSTSTVIIQGYERDESRYREGPVYLFNLKTKTKSTINFWPDGILQDRYLVHSQEWTILFDLATGKFVQQNVQGYAEQGDYANLLCNYPCRIYRFSEDGSQLDSLHLAVDYDYGERINNQYVLLHNRDNKVTVYDITHSKKYDLPISLAKIRRYGNMSTYNDGRELYLYDESSHQAYIYHLYENRIELRYNVEIHDPKISYSDGLIYVGDMCYYYDDDRYTLIPKNDVQGGGGGYIVEQSGDNQYHIYPIGYSREDAVSVTSYYPTILNGWELRCSTSRAQLINIMPLRKLIEETELLTEKQKHRLLNKLHMK